MPDTMLPTAAVPSVRPAIPVEIAQAIGEVMTQIKSLPKGERNQHGGYDFASIDAFLAAVGPLCSTAGLIVYQDEHSIDLIDRGGKAWLKATYSFRLGHTSGVLCDRPMLRTVFQSITGPQTTGSCQSYCLKQFLRSLFLIPTGDRDDADYHKQQDMPAAQAPQKPVQQPQAQGRHNLPPKAPERAQRPPGGSSEPTHMPFPDDASKDQARAWASDAKDAMQGRSEAWRRAWLEANQDGVEELRKISATAANYVQSAAISPDLAEAAE